MSAELDAMIQTWEAGEYFRSSVMLQSLLLTVKNTEKANYQDSNLNEIYQYIQEHYAEKITLEELAEQIHLCRSESCRLFKRYMNASIFDYLLDYRVERSLPLLRDDRLDVTQIAGMTGFSNPAYFAKIFRRKMGCTPFQYRKKQREENFG